MKDMTKMAYEFAKNKHGSQGYGEHPYMYHIDQVLELAQRMGASEVMETICVLHDTLEDTDTTEYELEINFGTVVSTHVKLLSCPRDMNYFTYIERISPNHLARIVKICDLLCNLKEAILNPKYEKLVFKYQKALFMLADY